MTGEFFESTFMSLITADMYIVIAAVYGICFALKRARFFDDRFIPLAAVVLGIGLMIISNVTSGAGSLSDSALKGIICGMSAVFVANVIKQYGKTEKEETDDGEEV